MTTEPIYVETEEEIPEVIERVRGTAGDSVPLVLAPGSRVARSRFNFQLLNQYAARLGKRVTIISSDPAVQEMARETGLDADGDGGRLWGGPVRSRASLPGAITVPTIGTSRLTSLPGTWARPGARAVAALRTGMGPRVRLAPRLLSPTVLSATAGLSQWQPDRLVLYAGGAAVLIAALIVLIVFAPSATVTLVVQATPRAADLQVTAAPGQPPIAVRLQSEQKSVSQSFQATGQNAAKGQAAKGQVEYSNGCPTDLYVQNGTELATSSGVVFAQQGDTQPISPGGTAQAQVVAEQTGASGNVGPNQITVIKNPGPYAGCLQVTNPDALDGGQDDVKDLVISQTDLDQARNVLQQAARQQITTDLSKQMKDGEQLSDPIQWQQINFSSDHQANDKVKTFNATLVYQGEAAYYNTADVNKAFVAALKTQIPPGQQLTGDGAKVTVKQESGTPGGHLTFKGTATGFLAPSIDKDQLRHELAGKSAGSARNLLLRLPGVRDINIYEAFPLPLLPFISSRIDVQYRIEQAPTAQAG